MPATPVARELDGEAPRAARPEGAAFTERAREYQARALPAVSRTFALTIPQLPAGLREVVGNAYLLCRIADTIEDEPAMAAAEKRQFLSRFPHVVAGRRPAGAFATSLRGLLSEGTIDAERDLVANTAAVVHLTHRFRGAQRQAIERCVDIMSTGMAEFAARADAGLASMRDLDRYCYHVAGVVGEMITDLVCDHSAEIARRRHRLYPLAADFGRGLQLVNILKDMWEDQGRGVSWLPRDAFGRNGSAAAPGAGGPEFAEGVLALVGVARGYLETALDYALLIPRNEPGIRRFLLWTLGMAVLTLRRIQANPEFTAGDQVKIPRRQVRATVVATSVAVRSDRVLRRLFEAAARPLPAAARRAHTSAGGRRIPAPPPVAVPEEQPWA